MPELPMKRKRFIEEYNDYDAGVLTMINLLQIILRKLYERDPKLDHW